MNLRTLATFVFLFAVAKSLAADIVISGNCGTKESDLTYTLTTDSVLAIEGTGAMKEWYSSSDVPWYKSYRNHIKTVNLADGVTSISSFAFSGCPKLQTTSIPKTVTSIGNYAFSGCYSLISINLPTQLTSIGMYAFRDCIYEA